MSNARTAREICQIVLDELNQLSDEAWAARLQKSLTGGILISPITEILKQHIVGPVTAHDSYNEILAAANRTSYVKLSRSDLWTWCSDNKPTRRQMIQVLERAVASYV